MKMTGEGRKELWREFEAFMGIRFPGLRSSDGETEETKKRAAHLHADLVEYDSHIADSATRLIENGSYVHRGHLHTNERLKSELENFGERNPDARILAERHLEYLARIHRLVEIGRNGDIE